MMVCVQQIGFGGKGVWQKFGFEMLKNCCKFGVVCDGVIDVIFGVKNIFSEMGFVFFEDDIDQFVMVFVLYLFEELGVEVDENEWLIEGEVIDVIKGGSKKQKVVVDVVRWVVEQGILQQFVDWVVCIVGDDKLFIDDKIFCIYVVQFVVQEVGKGDEKVGEGDFLVLLSFYLDFIINFFCD